MAGTPSFFLLSHGEGLEEGTWTQVRSRKSQRKRTSLPGTSSKNSRRLSSSSSSSSSSSRRNSLSSTKSTSSTPSSSKKPSSKLFLNASKTHPQQSFKKSVAEKEREKERSSSAPNGSRSFSWRVPNDPDQSVDLIEKAPVPNQAPQQQRGTKPMSVSTPDPATIPLAYNDEVLRNKVDENEREKVRVKIWNILFRNVNRTIDELYYMCEVDSSVQHCKDAEELLVTYLSEFRELQKRIETQNEFAENAEKSAESGSARETAKGVAWEVRKGTSTPSPITLLFGSRLRNDGKQDSEGGSEGTILTRRSLKELTFSSSLVNNEWEANQPKPTTNKAIPHHSAWINRPRILSDSSSSNGINNLNGNVVVKNTTPSSETHQNKTTVRLDTLTPPSKFSLSNLSKQDRLRSTDARVESPIQECPETDSVSSEELERVDEERQSIQNNNNNNNQPGPEDYDVGEDYEDEEEEELVVSSGIYATQSPRSINKHINSEDLSQVFAKPSTPPKTKTEFFTFEDLTSMSQRWGDEVVGLTEDAAAMVSPRRKRACEVCHRHVLSRENESKVCSSCIANAATKPGNASSREIMMRSLHEKLSSPERRKPSPSETKRRQYEKQTTARLNREKIDLQRQAKLRLQSSRQEQAAKIKEEGMLAQERAISEKLERAAVAREAKLKSVAKKAENESLKVNEIQFINEMTEQEKTAQLHKKLEDGEKRRLEFIGTIRGKAEKQSERAEARRLREEDKERQRREAIQRRHEEAEKRKAEALEEQRRKLDEMVVEASAKVNERRTEMEKEREARLILIKEREERAEQERMKHLLAKRASSRGSTSSPAPGSPHGNTSSNWGTPASAPSSTTPSLVPSCSTASTSTGSFSSNSSLLGTSLSSLHSGIGASTAFSSSPMTDGVTTNSPAVPSNCSNAVASSTTSTECVSQIVPDSDNAADDSHAESFEERQARAAEEESRSAREMDALEAQMRKRAKKCKARIAALCKEHRETATHLVPKFSEQAKSAWIAQDKSSGLKKTAVKAKVMRALDGLGSAKSHFACVETLCRHISDSTSMEHVRSRGTSVLDSLLGFVAEMKTHVHSRPDEISMTLELVAKLCELDIGLCVHFVLGSYVTKTVDLAVQLLRDPSGEESVNALVRALWLVRTVLAGLLEAQKVEEGSSLLEMFSLEIVRLCLYSSLIVRTCERCTQIKCGRRWMGCAMNNAQDSCCSEGPSSPGCPHVVPALDLVRSNLGLIEVLAAVVVNSDRKTSPRSDLHQAVLDAFLNVAESSSLFRIVSQLVAAYIAVDGLKDGGLDPAHKNRSSRKRMQAPMLRAVTLDETLLAAAQSGLRTLNYLACLRLDLVQNILGSPALPFELQQLFRYILSACALEESDNEMPKPPKQGWNELSKHLVGRTTSRENLFAELIVLMGFYAQCNEKNQESLNWGRAPTPLTRLCSAPFAYFTSPVGKSILFPTLLSICMSNVHAMTIVSEELSPLLLSSYLKSKRAQQEDLSPGTIEAKRFPKALWEDALQFLAK